MAHFVSPHSGLDGTVGMEDADLPNLSGEQGLGLESSGQKLPDFPNRPSGTFYEKKTKKL